MFKGGYPYDLYIGNGTSLEVIKSYYDLSSSRDVDISRGTDSYYSYSSYYLYYLYSSYYSYYRCQARITCGESQILLLSRWYGFDPRETSGSYYMRGIADFTSLEVRVDGMV